MGDPARVIPASDPGRMVKIATLDQVAAGVGTHSGGILT
jgi:hypothetical protein